MGATMTPRVYRRRDLFATDATAAKKLANEFRLAPSRYNIRKAAWELPLPMWPGS